MASKNGTNNALPGSLLLVIHDFVARSGDELSLAKGDRVTLIERDDDFGDGWFLGKNLTSGTSGLFPEVYTTPAPKGTLNTANKLRANNDVPVKAAQNAVAALAAPPKQQQQQPVPSLTTSAPESDVTDTQPPVASTAPRTLAVPAATAARSFTITSDSPVMSETLSVIDEHITDMKSPRASYANGNGNKRDTMSSVYSVQPPFARRSYIAGHETDEEEQQTHTEDEVMSWSPARVAEYLEDHGVERAHCDVFLEQEISGEVLLAMDQNSLFIKEFELGSVGRRLKTWHKIKALQDEVKSGPAADAERSASEYSIQMEDESKLDTGRNRSSTIGAPSLPRALTTKRASGDPVPSMPVRSSTLQTSHSATPSMSKRDSVGLSPLQSMTSISSRPDNTFRPSAQSVRNMNHSRRHSSIDSTSTDGASRMSHRKQPSIDQKWQPGQAVNGRHGHTTSYDSQFPQRKSSIATPASPGDLDRGYFSSNEADSRTRRSVLTKRNSTAVSPVHSRKSSVIGNGADTGLIVENENEGYRDPVSPIIPSSHHANAMNAVKQKFGSYRAATTPGAQSKPSPLAPSPISPAITKLDTDSKNSLNAIAASPTKLEDNASEASSEKPTPSPSGINLSIFSQAKAKMTGKRSISDAVTKDEKVSSPTKISSPTRTGTGSSTPSTDHRSLDISKTDTNITRGSTGSGQNLLPPPPSTKRPRAKSKKSTSAYTRGLEKKTPHEQMLTCDYSGWMKKKSGSLMATWKTRLFILKGRRLSYYYGTEDTEEKGLIDISFHRVLPAANETLTGVLAAVTGAGGSPTSPTSGSFPTIAQQDLRNNPAKHEEDDEGTFIFKLVPPKTGLAKGVSFTKPTVHYFAVNSRQEGRLWMAALMKATIDRDDNGVVTTTYNQKTISLVKARARRERPPALKEESVDGRVELDAGDDDFDEKGLGIGGLDGNESTAAGAEVEQQTMPGDDVSRAASTIATDYSEPALNDKEREAVALHS